MEKSNLINTYNEYVKTLDELNYLTVLIKYIIDNIDEEEIDLIGLDILSMLTNYKYDRQKLLQFRKEMEKLIKESQIDIESLSITYFKEIGDRIIDNINRN